jgi:hypothetical protein
MMGGHLVRATLAATAWVSVAFGVLLLALPSTGGAGTYATSSAAVALAAAAAGVMAGMLTLFAIAVIYAHLPPLGELHVEQAEDILGLALFVVDGLVVATVVSLVR